MLWGWEPPIIYCLSINGYNVSDINNGFSSVYSACDCFGELVIDIPDNNIRKAIIHRFADAHMF